MSDASPAPRVPPVSSGRRRRLIAGAALVLCIGAGLGVHLFVPDGAASDIAGDALYAAAAYLAAVIVLPRLHPVVVALIAAAWCVAIELFQLTGVPLELGARFAPAMLVLGTVFDARDLIVYIVTIAVLALGDSVLRTVVRNSARRS